jgi:hypothetical protein
MPPRNDPKPIGLSELIYQVKRELLSAGSREDDPVPLFAVDEIELEVAVTVSREGQAGINIQVLNVGGSVSREDAQTVRVRLKPLLSREELLAVLQKRNPDLFAAVMDESQALLKGAEPSGPPPSWP